MEFTNKLGDRAIQDVMQSYPAIGDILARYDIGCITCKLGICLLERNAPLTKERSYTNWQFFLDGIDFIRNYLSFLRSRSPENRSSSDKYDLPERAVMLDPE